MKATIKDVAKLAGVSVGTASKVINSQGNVAPEMREKVYRAVQQLNYSVNRVARSLRSSSTNTVAVLLAEVTNPFQMTLARGIEEVMYKNGYHLLISSTKEDPEIERENLKMLYEKRVDAIIVCTTGEADAEIRSILQRNVPIVLVDRPVLTLPVDIVADNNLLGMELLVKYIFELGHRDIGVVHGNLNTIHGRLRHQGVINGLELYELNTPPEHQVVGDFKYEGGYNAVQHFFSLERPPTAIICANNNMTAGVLRACRDLNILIPQDVSVVSYGDLDYTWNLITPSVTVVTQSPLEIGRKSAELVLQRLSDKNIPGLSHLFLTPELIVRESSGPCETIHPRGGCNK